MYRMECVLLNAEGAQTSLIQSYGRQSTQSLSAGLLQGSTGWAALSQRWTVQISCLSSIKDSQLSPPPKLGKVELATMSTGRLMV